MNIDIEKVATLVVAVAMLVMAAVALVVKLIELGRR